MKIEAMWCVVDPGSESEMADICFESTPADLIRATIGATLVGREHVVRREALAIYTDEAEALADAKRRLAARDAAAEAKLVKVTEVVGELRANRYGGSEPDAIFGEDGLSIDLDGLIPDAARNRPGRWRITVEFEPIDDATASTETR